MKEKEITEQDSPSPESVALSIGLDPKSDAKYQQKGIWYYRMLAQREELRTKRSKAKSTKPTQFEKDSIISFICECYIQGNAARGIVKRVTEDFHLSKYMATKLMEEAKSHLKEIDDKDLGHQRAIALRRLEEQYHLAFERKDLKNMLAIQKEINAMLGLNEPKRNEVAIGMMKPIDQMSNEELQVLIGNDDTKLLDQ